MSISKNIAAFLRVPLPKVNAAVQLLDDSNTIPFIARYRKEATGGLDEEQLRQINEELTRLRSLEDRRETILKSIKEQGKLTPKVKGKIQSALTHTELEDLYQPYKPKRKTRASTAREQGLESLADKILQQEEGNQSLVDIAAVFLSDNIKTSDQAW